MDNHRPITPDEARMLADVPKGAAALSAIAVLLLLGAWLAMYAFVFLPRGQVG